MQQFNCKGDTMRRQILLVFFLIIRNIFGEDLGNEDATPERTVDNANNDDQTAVIDETNIPEVYATQVIPENTSNNQETETPETEKPVIAENKDLEPAPQPNTAHKHQQSPPSQPQPDKKRNNQYYTSTKSESSNCQTCSSSFCKICKKSDGCGGHTEHVQSSVANHEQASAASSFTEVKKSPDGYEERAETSSMKQEQSSIVNDEYFKRTAKDNGKGTNPNTKKLNVQNIDEPVTETNAKEKPNEKAKQYQRDEAKEQPKTKKTQEESRSETQNEKNESKGDIIRRKKPDNQDRGSGKKTQDNSDNRYKDENIKKEANLSNDGRNIGGNKSGTTSKHSTGCKYYNDNNEKTEKTEDNVNNRKPKGTEPNIRTSENKNTNKSGSASDIEKKQSGRNENYKAQNPYEEHNQKQLEATSKPKANKDHNSSNARKDTQTKTNEHTRENKGESSQHTKEQNDNKRKETGNTTKSNSNNNGTTKNKQVRPYHHPEKIKTESQNINKGNDEGDESDKINRSPKKQENKKRLPNTKPSVDNKKQIEEGSKVSYDKTEEQNNNNSEINKHQTIETNTPTKKVETNTETPINNADSSDKPLQNEYNTNTNKTVHKHHNHNPIIEVKQKTNEDNKEILDLLIIFPDDDYYNENKDKNTENENPTPNDDGEQVKEKLNEPVTQNPTDQSKPAVQPKSKNCNCNKNKDIKSKETKPTESGKTEEPEKPEQQNQPYCRCNKNSKNNNNNTPQQQRGKQIESSANTQTQTKERYNEDTRQTNREIRIRDQSTNEANSNYNTEHNTYNTKYNTYNTESTTRIDNTESYSENNVRNSKNTEQTTDVRTDNNKQSTDTDSVRITNNNSTTNNDTAKSKDTNVTSEDSVPNKNDKEEPKTKDKKEKCPYKIYRSKPDKSHHRKGRHDATHIQGKQKIHHALQNNINIKTFVLDDGERPGQCFCCCSINDKDVLINYDKD